jgi:2-keto-4-pentenoate hydratase/2-oxohepta-3-ene-1,7-dioic acid hydratase in catechol pathway
VKLATFTAAGPQEIGIVKDGRILSVTRALPQAPREMIDLIARYEEFRGQIQQLEGTGAGWMELTQVQLRAPIARPGKILAIGLNYADHIAETGRETPKEQLWFMKASSSSTGPYDIIQIPRASPGSVDYEVELVAVIGRGGRHITREQAPAAVFGYCVGNDVSVREWQRHSPQWSVAKSFDTHSPFGPWITLTDELSDPHGLEIRCVVGDEQRQISNTRNLVFDVWAQIEYLSKAMTLEPGDLIFTGTPGGVGWARKPPGLLKAGDRVRCEIERLGYIEGTCADE